MKRSAVFRCDGDGCACIGSHTADGIGGSIGAAVKADASA